MTKIQAQPDILRAVGRRKSATARVKITKGSGLIVVNGVDYKKYFPHFEVQDIVSAPLRALGKDKDLDFSVIVAGGGKIGQAIAVQLGIARAMIIWNETFKKTLKDLGFLRRDPRVKERKKFGLKRARRAPQWSKR